MTHAHRARRRLQSAFKLTLFVIIFWSFTAMALTGELHPLLALGGYPLFLVAWLGEKHFRINKWVWFALNILALLIVFILFNTQFRTEAMIGFLMYLLTNKLWNPKKPRDVLQIYVITFFFMLSAAILTMGMMYMLFFIGYVFISVVGLALLTVRREHELLASLGGDRLSGMNPDEAVPSDFYLRAGGLVLFIFFLTFWIFMLFPRFSEQRFLTGFNSLEQTGRTGFTNSIKLGAISRIESDPTVVMRVFVSDGTDQRPVDHLYMRGGVLERYEKGTWSENPLAHQRERIWAPPGDWVSLLDAVPSDGLKEVRQTVYLNESSRGDLFMLENAVRLRLARGGEIFVVSDKVSNLARVAGARGPFSYSVNSHIRSAESSLGYRRPVAIEINAERKRQQMAMGISRAFRMSFAAGMEQTLQAAEYYARENVLEQTYLQLPDSQSHNQVRDLAQQIITNVSNESDAAKTLAIQDYLRNNYGYSSVDLSFEGEDPTIDFLFQKRKGHCEYFASAMALLLRHCGIKSRVVNGYFTDRWNEMGEYFQVEKSDAHSWVEAYIDGQGWVAYDPSPQSEITRIPASRGFWYKLMTASDAVKMKWRLHVIDYDMADQISFVGRILRSAPRGLELFGRVFSSGRSFLALRGGGKELAGRAILGIGLIVGAMIFGGVSIGLRRWRARGLSATRRAQFALYQRRRVVLYEKILKLLKRKGWTRGTSQTPLEFARLLEAARPELVGFAEITDNYYQIRYADKVLEVIDEEKFKEFLKRARGRLFERGNRGNP